jgi:hypothetical protein
MTAACEDEQVIRSLRVELIEDVSNLQRSRILSRTLLGFSLAAQSK